MARHIVQIEGGIAIPRTVMDHPAFLNAGEAGVYIWISCTSDLKTREKLVFLDRDAQRHRMSRGALLALIQAMLEAGILELVRDVQPGGGDLVVRWTEFRFAEEYEKRAPRSRPTPRRRGFGAKKRAAILAKTNGVCSYCGCVLVAAAGPRQYQIDHRNPLALGGGNEDANLVPSCRKCNLAKRARRPSVFARSMACEVVS